MAEFSALKNEIFNEAGDIKTAQQAAADLISLKNSINSESTGTLDAQQYAEDFFTLKDAIVTNSGNTTDAMEKTRGLFELRDTLNGEMNLVGASDNLTQLVDIQDRLNDQTGEVVDAIDTLEVLTDLNEELQSQVSSIGEFRKSLMDMIMMESTVRKAVTVLQPLTELSNLRRMSDADVRQAARDIVEQRSSRFAERQEDRRTASEALKLDDIQPFEEVRKDVLVPMPKGDNFDAVIDSLDK